MLFSHAFQLSYCVENFDFASKSTWVIQPVPPALRVAPHIIDMSR